MARFAIALGLTLALLCGALVDEEASAQAVLVQSTPALNETLKGPDLSISLRFSTGVNPRGSKLTIVSAGGRETAIQIIAPLSDTKMPLVVGGRVAGLQPGAYRMRWQVLTADGHIVMGDIPFDVR